MSESIDSIGATPAVVGNGIPTVNAATSDATTLSPDETTRTLTTEELAQPNGAITIVVMDAQGQVISTTTIDPSTPHEIEQEHQLLSITA
jgi:hypothetical protein